MGRGLRCKHCIELATGRQGVKRDTPDIIAISKVRVARRGISDLIRDLEAPDSPVRDTLKGISVVTGDWDVLVQLNGADFETVRNAVLNDLPQVPGILESDTLFTDGAYRSPTKRASASGPICSTGRVWAAGALGSTHARLPTMR